MRKTGSLDIRAAMGPIAIDWNQLHVRPVGFGSLESAPGQGATFWFTLGPDNLLP